MDFAVRAQHIFLPCGLYAAAGNAALELDSAVYVLESRIYHGDIYASGLGTAGTDFRHYTAAFVSDRIHFHDGD